MTDILKHRFFFLNLLSKTKSLLKFVIYRSRSQPIRHPVTYDAEGNFLKAGEACLLAASEIPAGRYLQSALIYSSVAFSPKEPLEAEPEACQELEAFWGTERKEARWARQRGGAACGQAYPSAPKAQCNRSCRRSG